MQSLKIEKNIFIFGDEVTNKDTFHKRKQSVHTGKVDIKRIVVSDKALYCEKGAFEYFIQYKSDIGIVPLCVKLPQINGYVKYFDNNNEYMNLFINDKGLLEKCNSIWDKN